MGQHLFRFAVQAVPEDGEQWLGTARRAERLGYCALLMPDGMRLPSPVPALALAAGATTTLHVGAFVLASPLRPPQMAASEAHTLSLLTGGRYELGIGTGRPEVAGEAVELLGQPPTTAAQRLAQVAQTIDALRMLDGERRTPVLMAAAPKARALAAAKADIVTLAAGAATSREDVAGMIADVRSAAGERASGIEFMQPIFVVGDEPLPWVRRFLQADMATLISDRVPAHPARQRPGDGRRTEAPARAAGHLLRERERRLPRPVRPRRGHPRRPVTSVRRC